MSVIQRLSEALANQIAAGEVIERPASVAKELIENAIDAGARQITVRLEDGGRKLLEVVDDGGGMAREDALLSLERHTTSKLHTAADLFDIRTFGFRGEALPSIASVSRFTLTTRIPDEVAATRIEIEGGKVVSVSECGAPAGTRVEVADLFFNIPARLKFLKTRATEVGHVVDWVTRLGLTNPGIGFHVTERIAEHDRDHLRADPTGSLRERIAALLGNDLYEALYAVEGSQGDVKVTGFAAGPQRANNYSREIFTFVNGRFVRDRNLLHAISRAYEGVLPIGRSPACVLFVEVSPDKVDVNVHPQKLEVRFVDQRSVYDAVARSLAFTLSSSPWLEKTGGKTYTIRPAPAVPSPAPSQPAMPLTPQQERVAEALERYTERQPTQPIRESLFWRPSVPPAEIPLRASDSLLPEPPAPLPLRPPHGPTFEFGTLRYLGQVHRTYLVCESPDGLILLDQHAAHERVLYERYRADRQGSSPKGQPFLVPITMELSPADARMVEAALPDLEALGFEIEPFGGHTFSLKAAPAELLGSDLARVVQELAVEVRALGRGHASATLEDKLLTRMACHNAVRAGHALTPAEVESLLLSLDGTPFNAQCPHGRPVTVRFGTEELKEMFGRTYEGTPRAAARERIER